MAKNSEINLMIILLGSLCLLIITEAHYEVLNVKIKNGDEIIKLKWKRTGEYLVNKNVPIWLAKKHTQPVLAPLKKNEYNDVNRDIRAAQFEDDSKNGNNNGKNAEDDLKKNDENDENENEIEDDEIAHGDNYQDKSQIQEYNDDILAKLNEDEENANNPMTNVNQDDIVKNAHDNDILAELTPDELYLINSIIDSADIPSISGLSSEHMIQHDVSHDTVSTAAHVSQIEPIIRSQNTVVHSKELNIFYAEILIFVGTDEVTKKSNGIGGIEQLILHYIVYFNAIDMLFAKLVTDTTIMHINIAGFEPETFPYSLSKKDSHKPRIHADKTLFKFVKYIGKYKNIFSEDSFDFFFVSTNYAIQKNSQVVPAYSRSSADIFTLRRRNMPYAELLGSIVHITDLRDVIFATRAIAELLRIEYVPSSEESEICSKHNCDIMKKCASFDQICLKWSKKSQYQFEGFFNSNPIRCFLLNYPRSLRFYGVPAMTTDPKTQCLCYGFNERIVNEVCPAIINYSACRKKLRCTYRMSRDNWLLPLDGTPCGDNMVCWRKRCVEIVGTTTKNPVQSCSKTRKRLPENDISETNETVKKPRKLTAK
ncbi:hypothetical protein PV328_003821 [Microctonus aethiopoides]|uniref:Uncharacterized protein n=1 Tax=Microctonus aethiopoides TaxID=144406 RepID=A0AA39KKZ2_9HYME|nr:hypothetical protein PV328_003821 [Microctonus aethiopoides]